MLGKLIKREWTSNYKGLLLLHAGLLLLCTIGHFILAPYVHSAIANSNDVSVSSAPYMILMTAYILAIIAVSFATQLIMVFRYYRTMYGKEGYLTHTLPVTPVQILFSKGLIFFVWYVIDFAVIIVSACLLFSASPFQAELLTYVDDLAAHMGISTGFLYGFVIGYMILAIIYAISMFYCSVNIGCLFHTHKIVASIVTYFLIYIVTQILSTIILMCTSYLPNVLNASNQSSPYPPDGFKDIFGYTGILSVVLCIVFITVSGYISSRKLNLD
ncbi:MAG: hypothetical protein PHC41_09460 [Lachnospiraceae bacterium]|nr:hypothetical protein [Lachnospiraceae bacterium]MDD3616436.1 hypothetical protein [Lachnospiraceae bacterium]